MGSFSIWHWLAVLVIVLLLFGGGGKIPKLMGDLAKGVKAFKSGLKDEESPEGPASSGSGGGALGHEAKSPDHQSDTAPKR